MPPLSLARRFTLRAWGLWVVLTLVSLPAGALLHARLAGAALEERARSLAAAAATAVGEADLGGVEEPESVLRPVLADPDVLLAEVLDRNEVSILSVRAGPERQDGASLTDRLEVETPVPGTNGGMSVRLVVSTARLAASQRQVWLLTGLGVLALLLVGYLGTRMAAAVALAPLARAEPGRLPPVEGPVGRHLREAHGAREKAEARAREVASLLDALLAHIPQALAVFDGEGRCLRASREMLPGVAERPLREGMAVAEAWKETGAGDGAWAADVLRSCLQTGEVVERRVEVPGRDGRERHVITRWVPIPLARDGPRGVLMVAADVTTRHRNRAELEEQADRLRRAERLEAVGRLTGAVAHDFNNLLTVVQGFCGLLSLRFPPDTEEGGDIQEIQVAAQRGAALTARLLGFARASDDGGPRALDPVEAARRVEGMIAKILGEASRVEVEVLGTPGAVALDAVRFEQVLLNLASNARDAMPGGGTLRVRVADAASLPEAQRGRPLPEDHVVLSVSDSGTGMDQATAARVFDAFFTTKAEGKGTGLGLATVQEIVAGAGGFIELDTEPGRGTTFHLHLPRAAEVERRDEDEEGAEEELTAPASRGERILVVDDDQQLVRLMGRVLRQRGYQVEEFTDPREALRTLEGKPMPDAVVADVAMPGLSGPELVHELRRTRPDLPVLFTSGYGDSVLESHGVEVHEDDHFLPKPFAPEALAWRVRDLLGGREG